MSRESAAQNASSLQTHFVENCCPAGLPAKSGNNGSAVEASQQFQVGDAADTTGLSATRAC